MGKFEAINQACLTYLCLPSFLLGGKLSAVDTHATTAPGVLPLWGGGLVQLPMFASNLQGRGDGDISLPNELTKCYGIICSLSVTEPIF